MKLHEGEIGKTYIVYSVMVDDTITRRLEALGVNEMTPVTLMNKKGSGYPSGVRAQNIRGN